MKRSTQLTNRFNEVLLDGEWIANTNYQTQLSDVGFEQAIEQVSDLNTIAGLTYHINYYLVGLNHFFETGELTIKDKHSFEAPTLRNHMEWESLKQELIQNAQKFSANIETCSNEKLAEVFVKEDYGTYERNIDAMIEHAYYHLGQISLIKKMTKKQ